MNLKYYIKEMLKIHKKVRQVPNSHFFLLTYSTNIALVLYFKYKRKAEKEWR